MHDANEIEKTDPAFKSISVAHARREIIETIEDNVQHIRADNIRIEGSLDNLKMKAKLKQDTLLQITIF